jgi:hypothetical protein
MPLHVAMHEPHSRIIRPEPNDRVPHRCKNPRISPHGDPWHCGCRVGVAESGGFSIGVDGPRCEVLVPVSGAEVRRVHAGRPGNQLNVVAVDMDWVWTGVCTSRLAKVVDEYYYHGRVEPVPKLLMTISMRLSWRRTKGLTCLPYTLVVPCRQWENVSGCHRVLEMCYLHWVESMNPSGKSGI